METSKTAFALGALGGNNAHGVAFLQAARDRRLQPDIISCTSGMVYWTYRYLLDDSDLEGELKAHVEAQHPFPEQWPMLNWANAVTKGMQGVFRPAIPEYLLRWMPPWNPLEAQQWLDRLLPAQWFVPTRDPDLFQTMADTFNQASVGVVFNVFEPRTATSYLHLNAAAASFMGKSIGDAGKGRVEYAAIDAQAVESALWLYLYGFEGRERMDGAYHRQIILRELHDAEQIYVVRPQAERWLGDLPGNATELRDLEIELWFNACYASEVAGIELVNDLVDQGKLGNGQRKISLKPVEVTANYGFFDYFVENGSVYDQGYAQALSVIDAD